MKRHVERNGVTEYDQEVPEVDAFLADIEAVFRKHGMSISHQDGHGAFEIEPLSEHNIEWLRAAYWLPDAK